MRIQELERQRDTACQVMQHMNNVNLEMKDNLQLAMQGSLKRAKLNGNVII